MRVGTSLSAISAAAAGLASAGSSPLKSALELFDFEKIQLVGEAQQLMPSLRSYLGFYDGISNVAWADQKCKNFPGGMNWPPEDIWRDLNTTLKGALLRPRPIASVCYQNTTYNNYEESKCKAVSDTWSSETIRMNHPIEVIALETQGLTCMPPSALDTKGCTQGGYPLYVVNASTVEHIQAAVNFARNSGVRLVIKNTGHDFSGKSLGGGSLSIWTHGLKDIQFFANQSYDGGYTGPAFKVGAGVQASEILKAASDHHHMVATGICDSVGIYGGYTQGGGHTPLGAQFGMGADQVISMGVVTADGKYLTASASENSDLFWAIRGGGGSTFGVVTSMVVKAYPDQMTAVGTVDFSIQDSKISADTFWKGVASYFASFEHLTNHGVFAQFNFYPKYSLAEPAGGQPRLSISPIMGIGKSPSELKELADGLLHELSALGINATTTWDQFPSYYPAFFSQLGHTETTIMPTNMGYGSRLIPRANYDRKGKLFNATMAAYRTLVEGGHSINGFQLSPTLEKGKPVGGSNAVLPAWRDALSHTIAFVFWPANATAAEQMEIRKQFSTGPSGLKLLRDVTPDSGSYMSEADRLEPDFQKAFYGENYPRLLEIKKKYDPLDVFYAVTAVGSERWAVKTADGLPTEDGPLCRV